MPQSKKRHVAHQQHPHKSETQHKEEKNSNAVAVGVVFFGLIGFGIGFFIGGVDAVWMTGGAVVGAVGGYLFGKQIDKAFSK